MLNISDLTAIKDALEEVYTDGINAIVSVDLDEDNNLFGTFRDGKKLYDFILNPDASSPGDQVSYTLRNPDVINKNDADIDWKWEMRNDDYVFVFPEYWRMDKAKNCTKGTACGGTCIPATKTCRSKQQLSEGSKTKLKGVKEKVAKSAKVGDLTRTQMQDALFKKYKVKSLKELARNEQFLYDAPVKKIGDVSMDARKLQNTNTIAQAYRSAIGIIPNDPMDKPGVRGVINGVNAFNHFMPTKIFGVNWTSTPQELNSSFKKVSKGLKTSDPELYRRLEEMKDSVMEHLKRNKR